MTESPLVAAGGRFRPLIVRTGPIALALDRVRPATAALVVIAVFTLLRLVASAFVGLGTDESYSVAVARDLRLSYFDHPPMHYWLLHAMEPLAGVGRASRLPFIALFAGSSWLMFVLTRRLFGARAGLWATVALNLSGFFTLAAGSWVLPDGPLIFFLLAAAAVLSQDWFRPEEEAAPSRPLLTWIAAGLFVGLAGLSKYQAALFCLGLGLFLITTPSGRRRLLSPGPYLAAVVALAVLSPVLIWNAEHHWASFAFQAGRGAPAKLRPLGPILALLGQAALMLPWVFIPMAIAALQAARGGPARERRWFLMMLALPAIAVFTLTPLMGPLGLPHWSMPGWLLLFPLLGEALARTDRTRAWPRIWAVAGFAFIVAVGAVAADDAATGWAGQAFPSVFRRGDPTTESIEWTRLRGVAAADPLLREHGAFIAALKWNEAGKIDQAVGDLAPVAVISKDPREFAYRHPLSGFVGDDALIIGRLDTVTAQLPALSARFASVRLLAPVGVGRGGRDEIKIGLVEARDLRSPLISPMEHPK